jgi:integrase
MRGSIVRRSKASWALVVDLGRDATGRRKQKWQKFVPPRNLSLRDAMKAAESALAKLIHELDSGSYIDASKTTLIEYLRNWHATAVVPHRRPETARIYKSLIEKHVAPSPIATMPLQKVRATDLEALYATLRLAPSTINVLHAAIGRAFKVAVRDRLLLANPATGAEDRPRPSRDHGQGAREHCWTADEARTFLTAATSAGAQAAAFYTLAIDTGARKSELLGLTWADLDLTRETVTIARQLEPTGITPTWAPTKTGKARTVTLGAETVVRLKAHRKHQRELLMANRNVYTDFGLVFARQHPDLHTSRAALGQPLTALAESRFRALVKAADVPAIKFHGLRHTAATLLLGAGVPVQVVAQRLGHAQISMTLEVYAHALPDAQRDAATRMSALLALG